MERAVEAARATMKKIEARLKKGSDDDKAFAEAMDLVAETQNEIAQGEEILRKVARDLQQLNDRVVEHFSDV